MAFFKGPDGTRYASQRAYIVHCQREQRRLLKERARCGRAFSPVECRGAGVHDVSLTRIAQQGMAYETRNTGSRKSRKLAGLAAL